MEKFFRKNRPENGVAEKFEPLVVRLISFVLVERWMREGFGKKNLVFEFVANAGAESSGALSLMPVLALSFLLQERHELPNEPHTEPS